MYQQLLQHQLVQQRGGELHNGGVGKNSVYMQKEKGKAVVGVGVGVEWVGLGEWEE
jgi:hypothetical protein